MKRNSRFQISHFRFRISNLVVLTLAAGSFSFAADPPRSTDDQLRDSLNSKAGDDYDRELLGDPAKPDDKGRADDRKQKRLQKELGSAAEKEGGSTDLLLQVAKDMREVSPLLDKHDSGQETQRMQRQIVSDLAKLIERAKKSGSCSGKGANSRRPTGSGKRPPQNAGQPSENSPQPAMESKPEIRKPEAIRAAAAKEARERMLEQFKPELQARKGEQMLELPGEYFLPDYELEIEDYFRRLSEDRPDQGKP